MLALLFPARPQPPLQASRTSDPNRLTARHGADVLAVHWDASRRCGRGDQPRRSCRASSRPAAGAVTVPSLALWTS